MTKLTLIFGVLLLVVLASAGMSKGLGEVRQRPSSMTLLDILVVPTLDFELTDRWRGILRVTFQNRASETAHIPWVEVTFLGVTYVDGVAEEWGIKGNYTTNYAIVPNADATFGPVRITEGGFDKEPKILGYELRYLILEMGEASATCQNSSCGVPIPELVDIPVTCSLILLVALALLRRRRNE